MNNPFTYCPSCGKKTISLVSIKELYCNSCDFTFFLNVATAVALIIEHGEKVILTRRRKNPYKNMLDLPGGFIDYDETIEEGLKREIKEELNIETKNLEYFASFPNKYAYKDVLYHTLDFFFISAVNSIKNITPADDVSDFLLFNKDEIPFDEIAFTSIKNALQYYVQCKK